MWKDVEKMNGNKCSQTAILNIFLLELVLSSWAKPGYLGSFYFWLDLIATLSLIPDIGWLWLAIGAQDIG